MKKALEGLRVLDLSQLLAAPQVSGLLADFGADVVKVEPPDGDPLRSLGLRIDDASAPYLLANRGKRRLTLDFESDLDQLHALLGRCDVVVCNQPRSVLEGWSCTPEQLRRLNPRLVVVTVSCYGSSGPLADSPGNGSLAEAFAGLTHLTGLAEGPPMLSAAALGDGLVAFAGAFGAIAACWHRDVSIGGEGQHVDVSMFEPVLMLLGPTLAGWDPQEQPPRRNGSRIAGGAPRNVYRTKDDRYLVLSGTTDRQVARVLDLLELHGAERERFETSEGRLAHADELDAALAEWIGRLTCDEALARLSWARIPVAPVNDFRALLDDPHVRARGSLAQIAGPAGGSRVVPGPPVLLCETPGVTGAAPMSEVSPSEVLDDWNGAAVAASDDSNPDEPATRTRS